MAKAELTLEINNIDVTIEKLKELLELYQAINFEKEKLNDSYPTYPTYPGAPYPWYGGDYTITC